MPSQTKPLFEQLDTWLQELQEVKAAAAPKPAGQTKQAGPSGMGKTTHPSEKVDDNTHETPEGARYRENASDVKEDVPANVEEADTKMDEDRVMPNIGTQQAATGEQTSVERDFKGTKDDGTTSHPADAEDTGEKYSSVSLPKLLKLAEDKANSLLADIGNGLFATGQVTPQNTQTQNKQAAAPKPQQPAATSADVANGYNTAAAAAVDENTLQKLAADFIQQTIKDADLDADLVGSYLTSWRQKKAAGGGAEEEGGEGGMPPGMDPAMMAAMGGGGGGMPPGAGGMPPGADAGAGGPPAVDASGGGAGAAGGMPPDAGGGPGGGGDPLAALGAATADSAPSAGDKEQALQDLVMAIQELGIDPAQLAQLAQQGGDEGKADEGAKLASAAVKFKRSGKFRFTEAKTAQERKRRDLIKDYVMEIAGLKG